MFTCFLPQNLILLKFQSKMKLFKAVVLLSGSVVLGKNCTENCDGYQTNSDYSGKDRVLMLNTWQPQNIPMILDLNGESYTNGFRFGIGSGLAVSHSCAVLHQGEFYVYGNNLGSYGDPRRQMIAKVQDCALRDTYYKTPHEMNMGSCASANGQVYLCFLNFEDDHRTCYKSSNGVSSWTVVTQKSNYLHHQIRLATNDRMLKL